MWGGSNAIILFPSKIFFGLEMHLSELFAELILSISGRSTFGQEFADKKRGTLGVSKTYDLGNLHCVSCFNFSECLSFSFEKGKERLAVFFEKDAGRIYAFYFKTLGLYF